MSDTPKVIDISERRKRDMPQAQTSMCTLSDALKSLLRVMEAQGTDDLKAICDGWQVDIHRDENKSILQQPMKCPACKWRGSVFEAVPDVDGEGGLGCPVCSDQDQPIVVLPDNGDAQ